MASMQFMDHCICTFYVLNPKYNIKPSTFVFGLSLGKQTLDNEQQTHTLNCGMENIKGVLCLQNE